MFETSIVELAVDRISAHDIEDPRRTISRIEADPTDVEQMRIETNRFHICSPKPLATTCWPCSLGSSARS